MPTKRVFPKAATTKKAEDYHGMAQYVRASPDVAAQGIKSMNLELTFEEALKLSIALSSCLHELNRYNRGKSAGREMGLLLSIKTDNSSIAVIEKRVKAE